MCSNTIAGAYRRDRRFRALGQMLEVVRGRERESR
jgi:hypothetical protein